MVADPKSDVPAAVEGMMSTSCAGWSKEAVRRRDSESAAPPVLVWKRSAVAKVEEPESVAMKSSAPAEVAVPMLFSSWYSSRAPVEVEPDAPVIDRLKSAAISVVPVET